MRNKNRSRVRQLLKTLNPEAYDRFLKIRIKDLGFGYDAFGLEIESVMAAYIVLHYLYEYWFRVESHGVENVPEEGPVLVTPNHSGIIPIDGAMIAIDLLEKLKTPRIMRAVLYNAAGFIPFVSTFFYRSGQVTGARRNFEEVLKQGELVAAFPEGSKGTWKGFSDRYRLKPFNVGFVELSLMYRTPIVPTAVIGAEEQYPFMMNAETLARRLRLPYFPLSPLFPLLGPIGVMPLPVKYIIRYGEPFHFYLEYGPDTVRSPETIRMLADKIKEKIEGMLEEGLRQRKGIFGFSLGSSSLPGKILARLAGEGAQREKRESPL